MPENRWRTFALCEFNKRKKTVCKMHDQNQIRIVFTWLVFFIFIHFKWKISPSAFHFSQMQTMKSHWRNDSKVSTDYLFRRIKMKSRGKSTLSGLKYNAANGAQGINKNWVNWFGCSVLFSTLSDCNAIKLAARLSCSIYFGDHITNNNKKCFVFDKVLCWLSKTACKNA